MPRVAISKLYVRPESQLEIAERAKGLLIRGDCLGTLPTPIEHLFRVANVEEIELHRSEFLSVLSRFSDLAKDMISDVLSKVRGAADLRKRVIFTPCDDSKPRILFARAHELGHQALPWHYINRQYLDDDRTLSPQVKARFEVEANLFAAETIYQGDRFERIARDYRPEFASVFALARIHGTSKHSTFWRFVEAHDDAIAGLMYYPASQYTDVQGLQAGFIIQNELRSSSFAAKYIGLTFEGRLDFRHPWAQARFAQSQPVGGEIPIMVDGRTVEFLWEAFWNQYCLLILVRRRPALRLVGGLFRRFNAA